jgi:uncharacterized protein (TIGR02598 family)
MSRTADGFTLVEVMVATSVLTVGVVALVQLALLAQAAGRAAARVTVAAVLAQDKMEQLRAQEWPEASAGCCDYFDAHGGLLAGGTSPPVGTAFTRRWAIDAMPVFPEAARVLRVWVAPATGAAAPVRLVSVRARRIG